MRSHRTAALIAGFALVVAACGGGDADVAAPAESPEPVDNSQPAESAPAAEPQATEPSTVPSEEMADDAAAAGDERPAPDPDRMVAPDFTLALGDGSAFVLSDETRPVFMVFWAEW